MTENKTRRKAAAIARRRRVRKVKMMRRLLVVTGILFLSGMVKFCMPNQAASVLDATPQGAEKMETEGIQENTEEKIAAMASTEEEREIYEKLFSMAQSEEKVKEILDRYEEYPIEVLEMLSKNEETLEFVYDYPEKKDTPCADTLEMTVTKGTVPLVMQWDEKWGYGNYGGNIVAVAGCGPTCLSMVRAALTGEDTVTPYDIASYSAENGFYQLGVGTSWDLMTYGCEAFGIHGEMLGLDENAMIQTLSAGSPIISSMAPGDFTDTGHFIVISGYNQETGLFQVCDPNSRENSGKEWSFETLERQIKNLWYFTAMEEEESEFW